MPLGKVSVDSTGSGGSLDDAQARAVLDAVTRYVTLATVEPLRSGKPVGDILYTALTLGGDLKRYYRYQSPDDGKVAYYDEDGK